MAQKKPLTLNVAMPCHPRQKVRLQVTPYVNAERYERTCANCGWEWTITRTLAGSKPGFRLDKLEWQLSKFVYSTVETSA